MTRTPCLEEMPITTEAATAVLDTTTPDVVNFGLWMQKEGYAPKTILDRTKTIRRMARVGTLLDGEAVKSWVSKLPIKGGSKLNIFKAYATYSKWKGFRFDYPIVNNTEPLLPFIPLESELDALIAGSGRKLSAFLLALKETGARAGEIMSMEWRDLDTEAETVRIRPEKNSKPRMAKLSKRLVAMMLRLPRRNDYVFGATALSSLRTNFDRVRKRQSLKLANPRLVNIHFHSFRHWVGTATYHKTKDILFVKELLGHRSINSTMKYTQLVDWKEDSFSCKTAKVLSEASSLIEAGFEYVTDLDGVKLFKKRK